MGPEEIVRELRELGRELRENREEMARLRKAFEGLAARDPEKGDPLEQLVGGVVRVLRKGRKK